MIRPFRFLIRRQKKSFLCGFEGSLKCFGISFGAHVRRRVGFHIKYLIVQSQDWNIKINGNWAFAGNRIPQRYSRKSFPRHGIATTKRKFLIF